MLPYCNSYCENQVTCHFNRKQSKQESIILIIPGGPGLSNKYLESFSTSLSEYTGINVGLIDLPNHNKSIIHKSKLPLTYQGCYNLIEMTLNELSLQSKEIILIGQSFGSRIILDLQAFSEVNISAAFLMGLPYQFKMSSIILDKINALDFTKRLDDVEADFINTLSKILPYYSYSATQEEMMCLMLADTKIKGNESIVDNVPDIKFSIKAIVSRQKMQSIAILQGCNDIVVPDDNFKELKILMPQAHFFEIEKCGHFPTFESSAKTIQLFSEFLISGGFVCPLVCSIFTG